MKQSMLRWTMSMVLLAGALAASGCAKKTAPQPQEVPPAPPTTSTPTPPSTTTPPTQEPTTPVTTITSSNFEPVFFDFDSYALRDDARAGLDRDAKVLRDNPEVRITIEGHCDERGTVEYNQALGERRAQAAREYLVAAGINGSRIELISYGKERPFDEGHDEAAWAKNRRAHFVVR
jgi:peptidoglycan-associated lipoprotein